MPRRDVAPHLYPNHSSADELVSRFGLDRAIAELVTKHRPYRGVDDLLRIPELARLVTPADLFVLVGEAVRTLPQPARLPITERFAETDASSGISYGIAVDVAGERRAFLADGAGNEIASAELSDTDPPVDLASLRIGGVHPYELLRLHPLDRARVRDYLAGPVVHEAAHLWRRLRDQWTRLDVREAAAVDWLSQLLIGILDLTRAKPKRLTSVADSGLPSTTPDVDWWDGEALPAPETGRGDLSRRAADDAVFERIRKRGRAHHPLVAVQFALAREALTAIDPVVAPTPIAVAVPPAVRYDAPSPGEDGALGRVLVRLVDVAYHGDDIGSDWSYAVTVDDHATKILTNGQHAHGTTRTWDRVIHDRCTPDVYGASFHLGLGVSAREHDAMWDDLGYANVNLLVACDPAYPLLQYRTELVVPVRERRWYGAGRRTARLRFVFDVETSCR
ncbi:MAG: hypothetical protein SFW08_03305 [Gemmatimonadaceae bacterium]|nr:hypothetical protein [Gemmatimonadaceae bacterium]